MLVFSMYRCVLQIRLSKANKRKFAFCLHLFASVSCAEPPSRLKQPGPARESHEAWPGSSNQRPVFRSRDLCGPITGQYLSHVIRRLQRKTSVKSSEKWWSFYCQAQVQSSIKANQSKTILNSRINGLLVRVCPSLLFYG